TQKEEREEEKMELSKELSGFDENNELRVLCFGSVHCGKSSLIDSILSTLSGKISSKATAGYVAKNSSLMSTTQKFQLYEIKHRSETGDLKSSHVYFGDMPGIQEDNGLDLDQVKHIVNGHVPNKYKIQDGINADSTDFVKCPQLKDRIHCVCFVIDISALYNLSDSSLKMFCEFQNWLFESDIPYIVVATKCDVASLPVRKDVLQVYENQKIKALKDKLIEMLGIRETKIYPVRNYVNEKYPIPEFDALLLGE
ncbi:interferon-induced protein 44-like, partial [Mercenaria mercenaria]|uniref:interferon-induced protein 44-like n=1 Tax=Mercenaria mercenaria TaxID=6596 RepID=UPI00234F353D